MSALDRISFNVNAELYENCFGELAIRFPGDLVFHLGLEPNHGQFQWDVVNKMEKGVQPREWSPMPAHELLFGKDWQCIATLGYQEGDPAKPAVAFTVDPDHLGAQALIYLETALPGRH
jgi:hypothetical protein